MANVLVTGSDGFIGRNLQAAVRRQADIALDTFDVNDTEAELRQQLRRTEVVFHLAGINRPQAEAEFTAGNVDFTTGLCAALRALGRKPKLVFASSIQAALDNPYGNSKRQAEAVLQQFAADTGSDVVVYRLPNVFGKWCRPNYNSVVATFCHNIARDLPIQVSDPSRELNLVYIDDVVSAFLGELSGGEPGFRVRDVPVVHRTTLGQLVDVLQAFHASRRTLLVPDLAEPFAKKLYATFLSYLPEDGFSYSLDKKSDDRGELAEFIKSAAFGQIFVSRTKPGMTRGNHFHHTKAEKFLVLAGDGFIRFRHVERDEVLEYPVNGRDFRVVDIPPGYTHSIENVGCGEMVVLFWASEIFDPQRADTYFLNVEPTHEAAHEGRHDRRHAA